MGGENGFFEEVHVMKFPAISPPLPPLFSSVFPWRRRLVAGAFLLAGLCAGWSGLALADGTGAPGGRKAVRLPSDLATMTVGDVRYVSVSTPYGRENIALRRVPTPTFQTFENDGISHRRWDPVILFEGEARGRGYDKGRRRQVRGDVILNQAPKLRLVFTARRGKRPAAVKTADLSATSSTRFSSVAASKRFGCGAAATAPVSMSAARSTSYPTQASTVVNLFTPPRVLELGLDADLEFFQRFGTSSVGEMIAIINQAEAFYTEQVGVRLKVTSTKVATSSAENPSASTDAGVLLEAYRVFVNTGFRFGTADAFHLFTGKAQLSLSGSAVVGLAFTSGRDAQLREFPGPICVEPAYAHGLSQRLPDSIQGIVTAHEIGHNFGARHPEGPQDLNDPTIPDSIMSAVVSADANRFSEYSRGQIATQINTFGECTPSESAHLSGFSAAVAGGTFEATVVTAESLGSGCKVALHVSKKKGDLQKALTGGTATKANPRLNLTKIKKKTTRKIRGSFTPAGANRKYYVRAVTFCTVGGVKRFQGSPIVTVRAKSKDLAAALRGKLK